MASSPKFNFPQTLTPINGKPTNTTLQTLQRQLPADYLLRAGVPFVIPVHPGPPPDPVGTAAVIGVALRNHAEALTDLAIYNNLNAALTAQILLAVNASFLSALEDPDFGFGDVSPRTMLEHLRTEYGTLTPEELERTAPLSPSRGISTTPSKIYGLKLSTSNVSLFRRQKFRLRPITEWTVAAFKADFILGNKERIRRLTAGDAGFHGAHNAIIPATPAAPTPPAIAAAAVTPAPTPPAAARHVTVEGGKMFYCWTHGLSPQRNHTSITCLHKAEGHRDDATAFRMRGGNNTISSGRPRQLPIPYRHLTTREPIPSTLHKSTVVQPNVPNNDSGLSLSSVSHIGPPRQLLSLPTQVLLPTAAAPLILHGHRPCS
ncbi:hypothetical protein MHU86_17842 [Fragilaria crotonensis]|nr:hypothetical protein MHU86_17842 [Fragilaria crotonensis]